MYAEGPAIALNHPGAKFFKAEIASRFEINFFTSSCPFNA